MKAQTQSLLRQWHQYIGLFLAPMILLLSISGAFQVFRLNSEKGWGGPPPRWLMIVAAIHKNQALPHVEPASTSRPGTAPSRQIASLTNRSASTPPSPIPLQIFVVLASIGLTLSTGFGVAIALARRPKRRLNLAIMAAGILVPTILLSL